MGNSQTVKLFATDSAYVSSDNVLKSFQTGEILTEHISAVDNGTKENIYRYSLLHFADDFAVRGKRILKISLALYPTEVYERDHNRLGVYLTFPYPPKFLSAANYYTVANATLDSLLWPTVAPHLLNQYNFIILDKRSDLSSTLYQVTARGVALSPTHWTSVSNRARFSTSTNAPYLLVDCEAVTPKTSYLRPTGNQLTNKNTPIVFSWDVSTESKDGIYLPDLIRIRSAKLRYRKITQSDFKEVAVTGGTDPASGQMHYSFPANTFESAAYEWQVSVTSEDNLESPFSDWEQFTTIDSLSTVQPISPRSIYLVGNEPNTFVWKHIISTGTLQTAAELQTSTNGQTWKTIANITGGVQQCVVPAGALGGDVRFWRARSKNCDGVAGQWSEAVPIVVYAAPRPPTLALPEGTPLLTITWQSSEQQAYETKAGTWQSGPVFGTTKMYTFPQWFSDGTTVVGVRVQSSLGLWSEWATAKATIINHPQEAVQLYSWAIPNGAKLSWTGSHAAYILYRDGKAIHATTGTDFTDWLTSGKHRYQVRGINGKNYALSNIAVEISTSAAGVISDIDTISWISLQYRRGGSSSVAASVNKQMVFQYFSGRTKPVVEVAEQLTAEHTYEFSLSTTAEVEALKGLIGHTVIFKGPEGPEVIGVLMPLSTSSDWSEVDVSFTITETDWREGETSANI